jgi:proteic killer suppression protein
MVYIHVIKSFKCRKTERLFHGDRVAAFAGFARQAEKRLRILDAAVRLASLRALPSNRFESLAGDRIGQCSIRINRQWRVCFRWDAGAWDV